MLFDYFYKAISYNKTAINMENKKIYAEAYAAKHSLKTSLGWYRSFFLDEKENARNLPAKTSVLYLKGEKDFGDIDIYTQGFRKSGLNNITGISVPESAHFAPEENPEFVARTIDEFVKN